MKRRFFLKALSTAAAALIAAPLIGPVAKKVAAVIEPKPKLWDPLTRGLSVWVDPTVAVSGDGTREHPVRTIQEALDMSPRVLEHDFRVELIKGTHHMPNPLVLPNFARNDLQLTISGYQGWRDEDAYTSRFDKLLPNVRDLAHIECQSFVPEFVSRAPSSKFTRGKKNKKKPQQRKCHSHGQFLCTSVVCRIRHV